jgi:bifunctional N-acetylglucosamine-1-phosphate-uridyltransferase/glucosamine-1-phosphate-acetyltransferase GlmU-like protein
VNYKKIPKSVGFNTKNERDRKLLKHVARRNFSGYVKNLIEADMKSKGVWDTTVSKVQNEPEVQVTKVNQKEQLAVESKQTLANLKQQLKRPGNTMPGPKTFINQPKD